jgi:Fanconi anemia group M protein
VIFFDNVPSSIRFVQRKGRTGRKSVGKLTVLIAKDTIDEAYYWVGQRKIKAAQGMGAKLTRDLQNQEKTALDAYF